MADPFLAEIIMFGGNFAPRGWAFCDGQLLAISQYSALFSLLGTTYGGDGRTTFALPDLRGRVPVGPRRGPGLTDRKLGEKGGAEHNTLNVTQLPSHNHSVSATLQGIEAGANETAPAGNMLAEANDSIYDANAAGSDMGSDAIKVTQQNVGGNQSVNNMQPWLGINYIIALQGIFPSRS